MRRVAEVVEGFLALPKGDVGDVLGGRRAMILAPHPDDESIGCGGLIAAACAAGVAPVVVILTDGARSHPSSMAFPPARLAAIRAAEARSAVRLLGLPENRLFFLNHPDAGLAGDGEAGAAVVRDVGEIAERLQCSLVIAPWAGDPHCDHEAAARIGAAAAARLGVGLLSYPVWGWLRRGSDLVDEPRTGGWRLDISAQMPAKQAAVAAHATQHRGMITDAPDGFFLPEALLAISRRDFEVFIAP